MAERSVKVVYASERKRLQLKWPGQQKGKEVAVGQGVPCPKARKAIIALAPHWARTQPHDISQFSEDSGHHCQLFGLDVSQERHIVRRLFGCVSQLFISRHFW